MKPAWESAPIWADYVAMDPNGIWYWYEYKPILSEYQFDFIRGRIKQAYADYDIWRNSLEKRPKHEEVE